MVLSGTFPARRTRGMAGREAGGGDTNAIPAAARARSASAPPAYRCIDDFVLRWKIDLSLAANLWLLVDSVAPIGISLKPDPRR